MSSTPSDRASAGRERLADAASKAFAERGFHATTTRDIAAAAGMSPAAVYVHHSSKEELLHTISERGHAAILELVHEATAASADPREQLAAVIRSMSQNHAENHMMARVVNYELGALSAEHHEQILAMRQQITAELQSIVDRGVASGVFTTSHPKMAANALLSLAVDVARWYHEDRSWTPADIGAFNAEAALRIVGSLPASTS
jgi:AcrR family transcriptional regulator